MTCCACVHEDAREREGEREGAGVATVAGAAGGEGFARGGCEAKELPRCAGDDCEAVADAVPFQRGPRAPDSSLKHFRNMESEFRSLRLRR